jgi:acyl-CoA dehydrogenase
VNAWEMHHTMNIPTELLDYLRRNGFLGMIIPKRYGGLEFSHFAHSQVITKLASASCAAAILTSVPNSLGPAELLLQYGTDAQKDYYLPRLAKGDDVPCFALTSPVAGSDAGAIEDYGIVCEAEFDGKKQLCIKLNWNKRYITLAPVATLLGLAFKLYDPAHLLGDQESLGITCALIPAHLNNVEIGRRHVPLHSPFPNGPTRGKDVIGCHYRWCENGRSWLAHVDGMFSGRPWHFITIDGNGWLTFSCISNRCLFAYSSTISYADWKIWWR